MAYSTSDDIIGEIPEEVLLQLIDDSSAGITMTMIDLILTAGDTTDLTDDQVDAATKAAANITRVLDRASAQVDGYCSNLYDVPFNPTPAFVKALDLDIAVYHLFSRRENVPENRKDRYNNAVKVLAGIAKGDIQLGVSGKDAPAQTGQTIAVAPAAAGIFTMDRLKNY